MRGLLFSLMLATGAAMAADATTSASPPPPQAQLSGAFNVLDTNADGALSRAEVVAIVR